MTVKEPPAPAAAPAAVPVAASYSDGARKAMPVKLESGLPQGALQLVVTYDDGRSDAFEASR